MIKFNGQRAGDRWRSPGADPLTLNQRVQGSSPCAPTKVIVNQGIILVANWPLGQ